MQTLSWIDDGGVTLPLGCMRFLCDGQSALRALIGMRSGRDHAYHLYHLYPLCSRRCDLALHVGCMGCGE